VEELLNGYVRAPQILTAIDSYIVPPVLRGRAGVLGALALAEQAVRFNNPPETRSSAT
jgi:fructokinase